MLQCIGRVGQVTQELETDVLVKFCGVNHTWRINPAVLSPAVIYLCFIVYVTRLFVCNMI